MPECPSARLFSDGTEGPSLVGWEVFDAAVLCWLNLAKKKKKETGKKITAGLNTAPSMKVKRQRVGRNEKALMRIKINMNQ